MSNHVIGLLAFVSAALLLSGCGKQGEAETVVEEFIARNVAVDDYSVDFLKLDSTTHVGDSLIERMKLAAGRDRLFKKDIEYGQDPKTGKYIYLPARIYIGNDTIRRTFYLDMDAAHVVAFK